MLYCTESRWLHSMDADVKCTYLVCMHVHVVLCLSWWSPWCELSVRWMCPIWHHHEQLCNTATIGIRSLSMGNLNAQCIVIFRQESCGELVGHGGKGQSGACVAQTKILPWILSSWEQVILCKITVLFMQNWNNCNPSFGLEKNLVITAWLLPLSLHKASACLALKLDQCLEFCFCKSLELPPLTCSWPAYSLDQTGVRNEAFPFYIPSAPHPYLYCPLLSPGEYSQPCEHQQN